MDLLGCDYYSFAIYGARPSLLIAVRRDHRHRAGRRRSSASLAGYYGGWVDTLVSRIIDIFFSIPFLLGAIVFLVVVKSHSVWAIVVGAGDPRLDHGGPHHAGQRALAAKNLDYVQAARALGAPASRLMLRHILPNAVAPVVVLATIAWAASSSAEATLTFLGVGLIQPDQSWGIMITYHEDVLQGGPLAARVPVRAAGRRPCSRSSSWATHCATPSTRSCGERHDLDRSVRPRRAACPTWTRPRRCWRSRTSRSSSGPAYGVAHAVNGVSFGVRPGETLAILGESGCGKSVTAQAVMGIIDTPARVHHRRRRSATAASTCSRCTEEDRRKIRANHIAMIFQDALSALNPVFTVGFQLGELFRKHRGTSRAEAQAAGDRAARPGEDPGGGRSGSNDYPHQFSGGMRQRVMIAMALALDPDVLIADEPTTALDVTVQAQIMKLLADLQAERNMGLILITHDMGVVADVADRISVMYAGRIIEEAPVYDIYANPAHPYTKALLESIPRLDQKGLELNVIRACRRTWPTSPRAARSTRAAATCRTCAGRTRRRRCTTCRPAAPARATSGRR